MYFKNIKNGWECFKEKERKKKKEGRDSKRVKKNGNYFEERVLN